MHRPRGTGCGWRKRQRWRGLGLQGPDKDACQREAEGRKDVYKSRGEKAREAAPGLREQWVLDFSGSLMRQLMERVTEASPGRPWRVGKWNYCGGRAGASGPGRGGGAGVATIPDVQLCRLQIPGLGHEASPHMPCAPSPLDSCQPPDASWLSYPLPRRGVSFLDYLHPRKPYPFWGLTKVVHPCAAVVSQGHVFQQE